MTMKQRFIVSANLLPADKRAGFTHEVVDSTHPSDGGPVAVALFKSQVEGETEASRLNLVHAIAE